MKTIVYLCRGLRKNSEFLGWWTKRIELPIPPFVGLGICQRGIDESLDVREVWITPKGAVVCELPDNNWAVGIEDGCDCSEHEWNSEQFAYETEGWTKTDNFETLEPQ